MNANDFTTVDRIIADVVVTVNDENFRTGFSKGWYTSKIQQALQQLAIETKYLKVTMNFPLDQAAYPLQLEMPKEVFDIREIYLYNGSSCDVGASQVVHWKRLFNNMDAGTGYSSRIKDDGSNPGDIFLPNQSTHRNTVNYRGIKYYYNVENGIIMLSEECRSYEFVRIVFNGFGGAIGDLPIIPRFFERAIIDWVEERYYNALKARDPRKYRVLWSDAKANLDDYKGHWAKTRKYVIEMDKAQKESMNEYISSQFHK